jgi:hypothetical protein
LQRHGDGHRLSCPPRQQSAALSKAGLAFILLAFFVATIIIATAATADAVAIPIAITIAVAIIAVAVVVTVAVATTLP